MTKLLAAFLAFFFMQALPAQELPNLQNWVYKDLKAQHQNWMIAQAQDHRMYFANSNGLLEFDGQHWQVFSLPQNQIVRAVGIDSWGNIFTGGYGEFGYWHANELGQRIYTSLSAQLAPEQISSEEIWNVQMGGSWVIFQSFTTLFFYNYHELKILAPPEGGSTSFIHEVEDRYFLFQQGQKLLELLITSSGIDFREIGQSPSLRGKNLVGMLPFGENEWLFCTARNGIFKGDGQNLNRWEHGFQGEFASYDLNRVLKLSNGDLAFGTILNGVYITDSLGRNRFHLNQSKGLQNNTILSLYQDQRKHLWIGTDNGVDMVDLNASLRLYRDLSGELGAIYAAAYFRGKLFLGSNHGLFCKNEDGDLPFTLIPGTQGQVWELKNDGQGLVIGHNSGTFLWDGQQLQKISGQSGGWCSAELGGQEGQFLQGTYGGIVRFDKSEKGYQSTRMEGFPTSVKQLHIDEDQWIWTVNPYQGLHRFKLDEKGDEVSGLSRIDKNDGLPTDFNLRLMGNEARDILKAGGDFYRINRGDIQPIRMLGTISLAEELQYLWLGKEQDTFLIFPDRVEFLGANIQRNLPLRLIPKYEKIEYLGKGEYLLCLESGYAIFQPTFEQVSHLSLPPLQITEMISLENQPKLVIGSAGKKQPTELKLKPHQRHLRFNFGLPFFEGRVRFRHRLIGFHEPWSEWSLETFKEYTNLAPGSYRLEIEEDQFGQRQSLKFYLAPPWYRSSLAYLIYFLLGVGLIVGAYFLHRFVLNRQQRRTALIKQREFQQQIIREKNQQLQKDIQNKSRELANSTMGLIRKNETLMELKLELEELYKKAGAQLPRGPYQKLRRRIDNSLSDEKDWQVFETNFTQVHQEFFQQLKSTYPELTAGDLRLAAFLRMGLSSKEIAPLFNISLRGIENKRYRLRKKMDLQKEENLLDVLMGF